MSATLPTDWTPNDAPTAAEIAMVLNAITRMSNIGIHTALGTDSLSSSATSYTDVTNASVSWTKSADATGSDIFALYAGTSSRATTPSRTTFGVNIGGTDYDLAYNQFNTASQHQATVGFARITGVAAGAYTVKLRAMGCGANVMTIDTNDSTCIFVCELAL